MNAQKNEWHIRGARSADVNFIYSTWLNSYRCDSAIGRSTKKSVFFDEYYGVIDFILSKPSTHTLVAAKPDNELVIFGFLVFEPGIIHYSFTKEAFRRLGIARSLYEAAFPDGAGAQSYTHKTREAGPVIGKLNQVTYNPFLLFSKIAQ